MKPEKKKVVLNLTADDLMLIIHALGEPKSNESAQLFMDMNRVLWKWKDLPEAED